jgi:hypothetical protein
MLVLLGLVLVAMEEMVHALLTRGSGMSCCCCCCCCCLFCCCLPPQADSNQPPGAIQIREAKLRTVVSKAYTELAMDRTWSTINGVYHQSLLVNLPRVLAGVYERMRTEGLPVLLQQLFARQGHEMMPTILSKVYTTAAMQETPTVLQAAYRYIRCLHTHTAPHAPPLHTHTPRPVHQHVPPIPAINAPDFSFIFGTAVIFA